MNALRKRVREYLKDMNRNDFNNTIYESMLTPRQEKIVNLHIEKDMSYVEIAMTMMLDVNVVKKEMQKVYDKLGRLYIM